MQLRKIEPKTVRLINGKKVTLGEGGYFAPADSKSKAFIFSCIIKCKKLKRTLKIDKNIFI